MQGYRAGTEDGRDDQISSHAQELYMVDESVHHPHGLPVRDLLRAAWCLSLFGNA